MEATRSRILDATIAAMATHGIARLSLEDVAREADLTRQTVYRYFGSREGLLTAAVLREEAGFLDAVHAAAGEHADIRPALEHAFLAALRAARDHPLLDRLLATEPHALLPLLLRGDGPLLSAARPALEALVRERMPHLTDPQIRRLADTGARLVISYAVNPPDDPIEDVAAGLADLFVSGLKSD